MQRLLQRFLLVLLGTLVVLCGVSPSGQAQAGGGGSSSASASMRPTVVLGALNVNLVSVSRSPGGGWRVALERDSGGYFVAAWRSSDGVDWERLDAPDSQIVAVAIDDAGSVTWASYVHQLQVYRFVAGSWTGPMNLPLGAYYPSRVVADGSTLVVVSTDGLLWSSIDAGVTWLSSGSSVVGPVSSVSMIGSYLHVSGLGGYRRWSFSTRSFVGSSLASLASTAVVSAPGSTSDLYAVSVGPNLTVRRSTDAGSSWSLLVAGELFPLRAGVSFGVPVMGSDGLLHSFGSVVETGAVAVYEAALNPVSLVWAPLVRIETSVASGSLLVWPTQRADGAIAPIAVWLMRVSGSPVTYSVADVSSGGVAAPWATSVAASSGSVLVSGLADSPVKLVLSPLGSWRVLQTSTDLFRSVSGSGSWEKIGHPPGQSGTGPVAVGDDGVVFMLSSNSSTYPTKFLYRFNGDWFGPSVLLTNPPAVYAGAGGLAFDGVKLVAIESRTGRTAVSTDRGNTWVNGGAVAQSDYAYEVSVLGGYMHVLTSGGSSQTYSRYSLSTNLVVSTVSSVAGSKARVVPLPGSTSSLLMVSGSSAGTVSVRQSSDSGATWSTVVADELVPARAGVSFGVPVMGSDGLLHSFGNVVEAGVVAVYDAPYDPVARVWLPVRRTTSALTAGSLLVTSASNVTGAAAQPLVWLVSSSGPPVTYSVTDVSSGSVAAGWVTSTTMSSGSTVIDGLTAAPVRIVVSPLGSWRVMQTGSDLYRSLSGSGSWEKIGRPPGQLGTGPVAVGDDGVVFMLSSDSATYPTKFLYRFSGDWFGPSVLLANPPAVYSGAAALVFDGVKLVAVESRTGRTAVSTDRGNTWVAGGAVAQSDYAYEVSVLGGYMHVLAPGGSSQTYSRYSLTTNAVINTLSGLPGSSAKVISSIGSVSHLWIAANTGPLLAESLDGGATWATVANGPVTAALTTFGRAGSDVAGYGLATCASGSYVFDVTHPFGSGGAWSLPRALALGADQAVSMLSTTDRIDGIASDASDAWVSFASGSTWSVERIDPTRLSPEAAYGVDAYGLSARGVNLALAGLTESVTDVAIAGVGPRLELSRTYNSQDRRIGAFGRGWTSTFETRVYENCVTKDVTVLMADGHREFFQWNGVSAYVTSPGYTSGLIKTGTTGWTLTQADGYVSTFRTDGRLTSVADADSQKLNLVWNASNELASVTDQVSGRSLTFTYSAGRVASVSTNSVTGPSYAGALTWNYVYSGSNLAKVCEPRNNNPATGSCIGYAVTAGRITQITDRNGHIDRKVGYVGGKLAWTEDGLGNRTTFSYPTSSKTVVTDANGHSMTSEFDSQFRLVKQTDAAGAVTYFEYNTAGFRSKTTDPLGGVTSQTFDARGNVTSETNALGLTRFMAYDAFNNLIESRDARSASAADNTYLVSSTWDGLSRNKLSESTPPTSQQTAGTVQSWVFTTGSEPAVGGGVTPKGLLKSTTNALGALETFGYDSKGNLRDTVDAVGLHTVYSYDELGRKTSRTSYPTGFPGGVTALFEYDQLGNQTGQSDPAATNVVTGEVHRHRVVSTFDAVSNLTQSVESDIGASAHVDTSRVVLYVYDANDRPVSSTNPEGGVATKEYDPVGNMTASTDARGVRREMTYDVRNLVVATVVKAAVVDPGPTVPRDVTISTAAYDAAGRQVSSTDARGVTVAVTYDLVGQVTAKTLVGFHNRDGSTRNVVLQATTYGPAGHPLSQTTGNGLRVENYTYDSAGRMVASTLDPGGLNRTTAIAYDAAGNVVRKSLSDGVRTEESRMAYDQASRVVSSTVENGAIDLTTTFVRDNRGAVSSMVEPRGNVVGATPANYRTDYLVDALGRTTTVTSPAVSVTENGITTAGVRPSVASGFDTYGQATQSRDERNAVTSQVFDRLGRVTQVAHPAAVVSGGATVAPTEQFVFDPVGNLVSRTDRRGQSTTFAFDGLNRVITQTDPAVGSNPAGVSRIEYDDTGNKTATTDPIGARAEATYDDLGRERTATSVVRNAIATPDRFTTTYDYDDLSNLVFEQLPTGAVTHWEFSVASEPNKVIDPASAVSTATYDVAGRTVSVTDPLGRSTTFEFDLAGRRIAERRYAVGGGLLTTETSTFDPASNLIAQVSPRGAASSNPTQFTSTFAYDAISRLTGVAQPTSASSAISASYRYDASGNQTALIDGRGNTTWYAYNPWGLRTAVVEPTTLAHPSLGDRTWETEYDQAGLAVRTIEPGGVTVERTYDALGRLTAETGSGPGVSAASRSFGYDAAGYATLVDSPSGAIGFVYDDRGLLIQATGPTQYQSAFTYDSAGRMLTRSDAAGTTSFAWTSRSELASITDPLTSSSRTNTFDAAGQLDSVTYSGGATRAVEFDDLGRLVVDDLRTVGGALTAAYSYGYDLDGHVTARTTVLPGNAAAGSTSLGYDNAGRLISWTKPDATTATYSYDESGNLVNNAGTAATFDARNQMVTSGATSYAWSARGTLSSTTTASVVTGSTFDGLNRLTSNGTSTYTYDGLDRLATTGSTAFSYAGTEIDPVAIDSTRFSRSPSGAPIAAQFASDPAVLLGSDRHGDIGHLFTSAGVLSGTRVYDPFGETVGQTGTASQLGFQGDYTDPTSGDVWMGARWYRPDTGGFASRDTQFGELDIPVSLNRYTYGWADPIGMFDPDGRWPDWVDSAVDTVKHGVSTVTGGLESLGGSVARALDVGEACTLCPVDEDGPMVFSIDEALTNPDVLSPKASLTNFGEAMSQLGKSLARDAISSPFTAFSGLDINTLEKVSGNQRAIAVFETALTYTTAAVRVAGFLPSGGGFHFGNVETDFNVNAPSRHSEHPDVRGGSEFGRTTTSGFDGPASTPVSGATNTGGSTLYTVQSADDAARLAAGGTPWPTSATRAEFGPGVYAWGNADDAAAYAARLESRGVCVQVCEFKIDTSSLRHVDVDSLPDPGAFMSKNSQLWGGMPNHGLDYITRGTQYGTQHYLSADAFRSATWLGSR